MTPRGELDRWDVLRPHLEDGVTLAAIADDSGVPVRTLQRWHAAYKKDGLDGLTPETRSDRGHGERDKVGEATESWVFERARADGPYRAVASWAPVHGNVCGAFLVASSVKLVRQGRRSVSLPHFVPLS